ncbi:MAG: TIGR04282 family arsenosugar biosynthesis glycosyltransferase [Actinobacteria bacterium]|nr:TIGR04282 family arsenosugar biosynthesis glycosyltransferase [Actinomycetota bacterium]
MRTRALVIIAKEPKAGEMKTKFTPEHTSEASAKLYVCFLKDIFGLAGSILNADYFISYYPEDADDFLSHPVSGSIKLRPSQSKSKSIGDRLRNAFAELFKSDYREVIIMDSDIPQLPMGYIDEAFRLLAEHDVVIGLSGDGIYQVIGLSTYREDIFEDIAWDQNTVLQETMARIQDANLRVAILPQWDDAYMISNWYRVLREVRGREDQG